MEFKPCVHYPYQITTYVKINGGDPITVGMPVFRLATEDEIRYDTPDEYDGTINGLERFLTRNQTVINGISYSNSWWSGKSYLCLKYNDLENPYKVDISTITRVQVGINARKVEMSLVDILTAFPADYSRAYIKERWNNKIL